MSPGPVSPWIRYLVAAADRFERENEIMRIRDTLDQGLIETWRADFRAWRARR